MEIGKGCKSGLHLLFYYLFRLKTVLEKIFIVQIKYKKCIVCVVITL